MMQPNLSDVPTTPMPTATAQQQDELEDLIYLISHDLRASLRALLEVPQWIEEDIYELGHTLPSSLTENIAMMNTHTKRLDRMLCDLLVFSRIGRMQKRIDVNLNGVLDELLDNLPIPNGFVVRRDLAWTGLRYGERDIVTLLSSLIGNAIKHHDKTEGQILIQTTWDGSVPIMLVSDDGPGIDEKFREIVFDIMQTLRPREEVEGSGMGLAISRKIAVHYGGSLRLIDPVWERGTTLRVTFSDAKQ